MALTDMACRNAKPKDRPYKLFDTGGLFLFVTISGSRIWRMKFKFGGKDKLVVFGPYPTVGLTAAREKRDAVHEQLVAGVDPTARPDKPERGTPGKGTFRDWAEAWLKNQKAGWGGGRCGRGRGRRLILGAKARRLSNGRSPVRRPITSSRRCR
jgi:hypothetical protein